MTEDPGVEVDAVEVDDAAVDDAARTWDEVAAAWDDRADYVDEHSVAATAALVDGLRIVPGDRVLELAAGPGTLGATWSRLVGPNGSVVVSDLAPAMVEVACRRTAALDNVSTAVLDASAIDRGDGSFDVVASRMGLMFTPDPARALAESRRVLAAGGRFGALTWAGPEHNPWLTCVGMAMVMAGVVAGAPPVGPGGIFSLGDPEVLGRLVCEAGFGEVRVEAHDVAFVSPSVAVHVARVVSLAGPLAAAYEAAEPDQQEAVRAAAVELAGVTDPEAEISLPGRALLVTGVA